MGQSLVKNYTHLIFSTKYRQHLIHEPVAFELHDYLGGICKKLECPPVRVGGYTDHVHILCMVSKKIPLMKLLEQLKSHSSQWMKSKDRAPSNFYWQNGYGAFSVSESQVSHVRQYIERQKEHHQRQTFQDEYRGLLKAHNVEYDERYVWD